MDAGAFAEKVMSDLRDMMEMNKEVPPVIFIPVPGVDEDVGVIPTGWLPSKSLVFGFISRLRARLPFLMFVSESWSVVCDNESIKCAPSEHPDRKEVVIAVLYNGVDVTMWTAEILRSAEWVGLGEWVEADVLKGAMVQTPPEWN